jgi:hypothetical protein
MCEDRWPEISSNHKPTRQIVCGRTKPCWKELLEAISRIKEHTE